DGEGGCGGDGGGVEGGDGVWGQPGGEVVTVEVVCRLRWSDSGGGEMMTMKIRVAR
ncbi:hypothetical protein Tco_1406652, partial [Tanacetum coccineum]